MISVLYRHLLVIVITALMLISCAPRQVITVEVDPTHVLLSRAEKMYRIGSDEKAVQYLQEYRSKNPDSPLIPAVLIKLGRIHIRNQAYESARQSYRELIYNYPESSYVTEAKIGMISCDYHEGKYEEVIGAGDPLIEQVVSEELQLQLLMLIGDALMAEKYPDKAIDYYLLANERLKNVAGKAVIVERSKVAVSQLSTEKIISLLGDRRESEIKGYLLFQLGRNNLDEDKFEDALRVLTAFINLYPQNEYVLDASRLIERIDRIPSYRRFTVGCLLPLSGAYKAYGEQALKGVQLALTLAGNHRSVESINIIIKDTQSDPHIALRGFEELYQENVSSIIGPIVTADVVASEAQKRGIPIITLTLQEVPDIGDHVFRNFLTPEMQIQAIVAYAAKVRGIKKFAVLYPDERYGHTMLDHFWRKVMQYGGKMVAVERYEPNITDFGAPIRRLISRYETVKGKRKPILEFEALFIPDSAEKIGLIIPQLAFHDMDDVLLLGTNLWHSQRLLDMTGSYIRDAVIPNGFASESTAPHVVNFTSNFQTAFGELPGFIEAVAYDTAYMLFTVIADPDVRYRSTLKNFLLNIRNFPGVTGLTSFAANGDAIKEIYLIGVQRDKFVEINSPIRLFSDDI